MAARGRTGTILFARWMARSSACPTPGEAPRLVETCRGKRDESGFIWPRFLPDGRRFLVSKRGDPGLFVASLDAADCSACRTTAPAQSTRQDTCCSCAVECVRPPVRRVTTVFTGPERLLTAQAGFFSVSDNGTVVYKPERPTCRR